MYRRRSTRSQQTLGCAVVLAAALLGGGCEDPIDGFAVRGTAAGVLGPVVLELRVDDYVERLTVTRDGPFAFEIQAADGAAYDVTLAGPDVPCALRNQSGVVAGRDTAIELTCTGPSLASLVVSGIAPAVPLAPDTFDYVVELPLSQAAVTLTATVTTTGDTLTIAGAPVPSGTPSAELPLALGDNPVDVAVESPLGWRRTYRVTLRRAARLAQYVYGKASNAGAYDRFGWSVALSGDTLAVGAYTEDSAAWGVGGDQDDEGAGDSGAVYVFRRMGTAWVQEAYLKAINTGVHDYFGKSLALSGDVLAAGAYNEDSATRGVGGSQADNSASDSGAVYVFRRTGTTWRHEAYVKASNTGPTDHFGISVALDGDTLAVGAWLEDSAARGVDGDQDDESAMNSGAVYVFRHTGSEWQQEAYLKASNAEAGDNFGISVALSGDVLAAGAFYEDSAARGVDGDQDDNAAYASGAAYVFRRTGTAWQQEAYLKASSPGADDLFGTSVAVSGDTVAVGAPHEDSVAQGGDSPIVGGAVHVFRHTGAAWQQEGRLVASNAGSGDEFGRSVALSGDILAVGAPHEASAAQGVDGDQDDDSTFASGAAYVFRRTGTAWQQQAYVKASNPDLADYFGRSVALSGATLAVGASGEDSAAQGVGGDQDDDSAEECGAVYVFH